MLLSDFFQKKRKQRIEAAKAEGIAQGKAEAEAKVLNEFAEQIENAQGKAEAEAKVLSKFAERIENAQGNTKAEAKVLSKFAEQIENAKAKGREEGIAKGREEGIAEGREEGIAKGREEGIAEGRIEGASEVYNEIAKLNHCRKEAEARGEKIPVERPDELFFTKWDNPIPQNSEKLDNFLFES